MAFIDELTIFARGGTGGDGVVRWRQDKFEDRGGPAGGDGGRGGDVYIEGVKDSGLLASYTHDTKFLAPNGESGAKKKMSRMVRICILSFRLDQSSGIMRTVMSTS
jgi:GTPase